LLQQEILPRIAVF